MSNKRIQFHSDNIAVVYIINKKTSKDPVLMKLLRRLVVQAMKFNILFEAVHILGMLNTLADKLSRFHLKDIEREVPYLAKRSTDVSYLMSSL